MLVLRNAQQSDFERLPRIYNLARASAGCFAERPVSLIEMLKLVQGERVCIAQLDQHVAGFVSVWQPDLFIHHLYVLPAHQNCGVGSALLEYCEREYGAGLSLKCEVANNQAQEFYHNKGWVTRESGVGTDGPWERLYSPASQ